VQERFRTWKDTDRSRGCNEPARRRWTAGRRRAYGGRSSEDRLERDKRERWRDPRVAEEYEARRFEGALARWKHRRDVVLVLDLLAGVPAGARVLDLPCGTGRLLPALRAAGLRGVGADLALEMMRAGRARRSEPGPLVQADAVRLPFRAGAFDAVVSLRFLFHLAPEERRAALVEMARVARNGTVVGEVRYRRTWKHAGRYLRSRVGLSRRHRPAPGRAEIEAELAAAGLALVRFRPVSRTFSDKALFLACAAPRPRARLPSEDCPI
jgi:SAM-dependent methyltransferase